MKRKHTPKKPAPLDWHPADVKARLEKAGWSLRRLSAHHGMVPQSIQKALYGPWPRAEALIAAAIGERPQRIWPSRYHADGTPKRGRIPNYNALDAGSSSASDRRGMA